MDFVKATNHEYEHMLKHGICRTTFISLRKARKALSAFFFFLLAIFSVYYAINPTLGNFAISVIGLAEITTGIFLAPISGFIVATGITILFVIMYLIFSPVTRLLHYGVARKNFLHKVGQLERAQYEQLITEYSGKKQIKVYYDKRKKIIGSGKIYVTDNFLFVPGLLLITREEVGNVKIAVSRFNIAGTGSYLKKTKIKFMSKGTEHSYIRPNNSLSAILAELRAERTVASKASLLPVKFDYDESPETAEHIMAWFWQCELDDPSLSERTSEIITEY